MTRSTNEIVERSGVIWHWNVCADPSYDELGSVTVSGRNQAVREMDTLWGEWWTCTVQHLETFEVPAFAMLGHWSKCPSEEAWVIEIQKCHVRTASQFGLQAHWEDASNLEVHLAQLNGRNHELVNKTFFDIPAIALEHSVVLGGVGWCSRTEKLHQVTWVEQNWARLDGILDELNSPERPKQSTSSKKFSQNFLRSSKKFWELLSKKTFQVSWKFEVLGLHGGSRFWTS